MINVDEALMCADNMGITIDAEAFACDEDFALVCLADEVSRLQAENERLKSNPPQSMSPWQPISTPIENGRRVFVASTTRAALFHGQYREYPFHRVVANDGSYITEFYAWIYEPEMPPLPEPAP